MNFTEIDVSKIKFGELVESKKQKGYRSGNITYEGQPLLIQVPFVLFPFGVSPPNPDLGITKWSLSIARDENGVTKPIVGEFFKKIEEIENRFLHYVSENAQDYFGGKKSLETCKDFMNKIVKYDKNAENAAKYGPRIAPVVPYDTENNKFYDIECYDVDKSEISPEKVQRKSKGMATIQLATNYSVGGKAYGITMNTKIIKVLKHASNAAPPIKDNMYGYDPELEAAMLAATMPPTVHPDNMYGDAEVPLPPATEEKKRTREESAPPSEEPAPSKPAKKGKAGKK